MYCMIVLYMFGFLFFFFKQKTAYEMRISDWSSDVCSSDLVIMKIRSCFDAFICINQIFETGWKIREEKYDMKDANYDSLLALKSVATIKSPYLLVSSNPIAFEMSKIV